MKAILDVKLVNTVNVKEIKKYVLFFFLTGNILLLIGRNNAVWFHYYTQHNLIFFDSIHILNAYSEIFSISSDTNSSRKLTSY